MTSIRNAVSAIPRVARRTIYSREQALSDSANAQHKNTTTLAALAADLDVRRAVPFVAHAVLTGLHRPGSCGRWSGRDGSAGRMDRQRPLRTKIPQGDIARCEIDHRGTEAQRTATA